MNIQSSHRPQAKVETPKTKEQGPTPPPQSGPLVSESFVLGAAPMVGTMYSAFEAGRLFSEGHNEEATGLALASLYNAVGTVGMWGYLDGSLAIGGGLDPILAIACGVALVCAGGINDGVAKSMAEKALVPSSSRQT